MPSGRCLKIDHVQQVGLSNPGTSPGALPTHPARQLVTPPPSRAVKVNQSALIHAADVAEAVCKSRPSPSVSSCPIGKFTPVYNYARRFLPARRIYLSIGGPKHEGGYKDIGCSALNNR